MKFERGTEMASQGDIEALLRRVRSTLAKAGVRNDMLEDSSGGGDAGSHGRKRRALGHLTALLRRSRATVAEVRAMHALLRELEELH